MIIKTPDYQKAIDAINQLLDSGRVQGELRQQLQYEAAGLVAEQQVAYQLASYFQNSEEIYIYNNLFIENGAVTAQIDHLVFSRRMIYFIESKSIAGAISVNEAGEFQRQYGKKFSPIKSPIEQVKRQRQVLLDFLDSHRNEFLGKVLFMRKGIGSWTPKYYVGVSEKGTIKGPGRSQFKELMKFDQIASAISEHHKQTKIGLIETLCKDDEESFNLLNKDEIKKVSSFLEKSDKSKEPIQKIKELLKKPEHKNNILPARAKVGNSCPAQSEAPSLDTFSCSECGSHNLKIAFGRNYYFKCNDCGDNTPIKLTCEKCSGPMRIRKQKNKFYKVCKQCDIDTLYYVNSGS